MNWHEFIFSNKQGERIRRHLIFWVLWWIYFAATYYYYVQVGLQRIEFGDLSVMLLLKTFLLIIIHIVSCYSFIYFLLPRYLLTGKYFELGIGMILLTAFLLLAGYYVHLKIFPIIDQAYHNNLAAANTIWWTSINSVLLNAPKIIAAATAIILVKRWYLKQKEKEKAEQEKLITDLQLLKAQIHPVFLFASLDHIYEYAKNKSSRAQELLIKFADLLSYLLYESDEVSVPLEKELRMTREYMEMEKIKYGRNLEMEIEIKGSSGNIRIAPLILLPFIENSFRQCNTTNDQSWINLVISIDGDLLTMRLMNGIDSASINTGLKSADILNVEKRLGLLYRENYELKMYAEQEIAVTLLKINLEKKFDMQSVMSSFIVNDQQTRSLYATN